MDARKYKKRSKRKDQQLECKKEQRDTQTRRMQKVNGPEQTGSSQDLDVSAKERKEKMHMRQIVNGGLKSPAAS